MVEFFIRRPIFATVCALLIILAGAISIPSLPISEYPQLTPPTITVTAAYNGANATEVESAVTIPLERAINGATGLQYLSSTSTNSGVTNITATFTLDSNIDLDRVSVQNRVNSVLGTLPARVTQTGIQVNKSNSGFVFAAAVTATHGQYGNIFMSNYLDLSVVDALKRIPGVANVNVFGERLYAMRVWLDPAKLAARQLTAADVIAALQQQNVQVAAGDVGAPPAPAGQSYELSVRAEGELSTPAEFDNVVLKTEANGTLVKIGDVGNTVLGAQDYSGAITFDGQPAVGLGVQQLPSADALAVAAAAQAELATLAKTFPPGMVYHIAFDPTAVVREGIRDVLITLAEAIGLVILVMFVFLQDWRTTVIPAVTIPVSLVGAFAFVKLMGFSINMLTLFGIILATGLVVDDAIVVIENVERHLSEGVTEPHRATSVAMTEVAGAVVATALALIAVFVPVSLFPGTTGVLFRQFGLTIAFSVAISMFNSLTLSPALSALLLGKAHPGKHGLWKWINDAIQSFTHAYRRWLASLIRWRWVVLLFFIAALGLTYWVYESVPGAFLPSEDQGYFFVLVQAPSGASLGYTTGISDQAIAIIRKQPEVSGIFSLDGFSQTGSAPNAGMMFVTLKPFSQRTGPQHSAEAVLTRLRGPLFGIHGAVVRPFSPPPIQGLSNFGGFQFELVDQSGTHTPAQLYDAMRNLIAAANRRPELTGLFSSFTANDPQLVVSIDRQKAESLQVPFSQITDALQGYMGSVYVNNFYYNDRVYRVYVQASAPYRQAPSDIGRYYVRGNTGPMIPLSNLVTIATTTAPSVINHYDVYRSAEIDGSAAPDYSSGQSLTAMEQVADKVLPQGMSYMWTGISLQQIESAGQTVLFFGLGLVVVYLTLSALYESWVLPFIVLLGVPVAALGGLGAQALRGYADDVYCQIGLVMLIGLASKNAILIVEFAEQLRHRGLPLVEAALEAARIRLRPILMTSLAFILGVLPLVVASGAGAGGRHSVGTTVFGGMLLSTFLNLVFIPVLYVIIEQLRGEKLEPKPSES
jgi:hydrophobic/amphiphilic exporter-1 (mainly G- bacteria), HAE1 family